MARSRMRVFVNAERNQGAVAGRLGQHITNEVDSAKAMTAPEI